MEQFVNLVIKHGDTIIVVIVALILGWDKFRNGSNILQKQILDTYKERNQQLEAKLKTQEDEFKHTIKELSDKQNETNIKLARLETALEEKEKRIKELTLLNNDKNPDVLNILRKISESNERIMQFMEMMHTDSKEERKHQTDILDNQVIRERNIDEASANETGDPMRTPAE